MLGLFLLEYKQTWIEIYWNREMNDESRSQQDLHKLIDKFLE